MLIQFEDIFKFFKFLVNKKGIEPDKLFDQSKYEGNNVLYLGDIYKMFSNHLKFELNEEEEKVVRDGIYKETGREYLEKD